MYLACICCFHKDVCVASSKYTSIWLAFIVFYKDVCVASSKYTSIWLAFIVFIRMFV